MRIGAPRPMTGTAVPEMKDIIKNKIREAYVQAERLRLLDPAKAKKATEAMQAQSRLYRCLFGLTE